MHDATKLIRDVSHNDQRQDYREPLKDSNLGKDVRAQRVPSGTRDRGVGGLSGE